MPLQVLLVKEAACPVEQPVGELEPGTLFLMVGQFYMRLQGPSVSFGRGTRVRQIPALRLDLAEHTRVFEDTPVRVMTNARIVAEELEEGADA